MPPKMTWLATVLRVAIAPVLVGALLVGVRAQRLVDLAVAGGLVLLSAVYLWYWSQPWQRKQRRAVVALAAMVPAIAALQNLLGLPQPLLWLYPAVIGGAGLAAPLAAGLMGLMGLMAIAAVSPLDGHSPTLITMLGSGHTISLSIVLAGLGMVAVRQLIAVNAELHAARAELAELAVTRERDRLARDLHDLLGRTLSLIAVKAELASRLIVKHSSAGGPPETEMREVEQLARQALRDVRDAVTGSRIPTIAAELAAAQLALKAAGIQVSVAKPVPDLEPTQEVAIAWAIREAVTNVVKHSDARNCRIVLRSNAGTTSLEVTDDGWGPGIGEAGSGLGGLAERVQGAGGTLETGPGDDGGFRLQVVFNGGTHAVRRVQARA